MHDQLMTELRREDPRAFEKFLCMPVERESSPAHRETVRLVQGTIGAATLRHLVSGAKYSDMLYSWRVPEK